MRLIGNRELQSDKTQVGDMNSESSDSTRLDASESATTPPISGIEGDPDLPQMFGRYRIIRRLGGGGMGNVFLAWDTQLDRQVALKVPHFDLRTSVETLQRFDREAKLAARLSHAHICHVYDVGEANGQRYITMEFIDGQPLSHFVGHKSLSDFQAVQLVRKVAGALCEAHRMNIIHRDLKPANIMLTASGEPKVTDFGLARLGGLVSDRLTQSGAILGTPAYMPGEQLRGDREQIGPATDIYSLGVVLYELLTGKLPYDVPPESPVTALFAKILTDPPIPPSHRRPDLDCELEAVMLKSIAKSPAERYSTMEAYSTALGEYLQTTINRDGCSIGDKAERGQAKSSIPRGNEFDPSSRASKHGHRQWTFAGFGLLALFVMCGFAISQRPVVLQLSTSDNTPERTRGVEEYSRSTGMTLVRIPGGEFLMGTSATDEFLKNELFLEREQPQHKVRITTSFYLGKFEVTQGEYRKVVGRNPSAFALGGIEEEAVAGLSTDRFPVEMVSFFDAIAFCNALSTADGFSPYYSLTKIEWDTGLHSISAARVSVIGGNGYRLPTEAEWEYACRGGTTTPFHFGSVLNGDQANVNGSNPFGTNTKGVYLDRTTTVDDPKYPRNSFGLSQMHGNVWELCWDTCDKSAYVSRGALTSDPVSTNEIDREIDCVFRGGSYDEDSVDCRSANRPCLSPRSVGTDLGFRIARTP